MRKKKIKAGLVCVALEGERLDMAEQFLKKGSELLRSGCIEIVNDCSTYTLSKEEVKEQTKQCVERGACAVIYMVGTWLLADHIIDAVRDLTVPVGIWGIPESVSFSSVGANVVHGAMEEMNLAHELFYGRADDPFVGEEIGRFVRACHVKEKLRNARFGMIGGRAISAYPTAGDPNQIKKLFGTEIEHIDQLLLLERARQVPEAAARDKAEAVKRIYGSVNVADEILLKSVKVYFALKEIIEEYRLDMCSVKCIGEFLDHYTSCCLAISMLNDEGYLVNCQCNLNAMLSSFILAQFSDDPVYFGDINMVDKENGTARVINCGSIPGRLAESYEDVQIVTQYEYMGKGLGACTLFCCRPGAVTFGTLARVDGEYVMASACGEAFKEETDRLTEVRTWAQGFIRLHCEPMEFFRNIRSNHSVFCYGIVKDELEILCRLLGIRFINMGE